MGLTQNLGRLSPSIFSDASLNIGVGAAPSGSYKFEVTGTSKVSGVLTLGSTLSNGTYTYTLPSATGTLALTSDLSGYLPLTGGTLTGALGGTSASFSGTIQTSSATTGGSVKFNYGANAVSRSYIIISDAYNYGDLGFQQSTTQTGSTYSNKMILAANGDLTIGSVPSTGVGNLYAGAATFSSSVTASQFLATSSSNAAIITSTGTTGYGLVAVGSSGGARDILLAGQSGVSNGFTVQYNGSAMVYTMASGNLSVSGGSVTANGGFYLPSGGAGTSPTLAYNNSLSFGLNASGGNAGIYFGNLYNSDYSTSMQFRVVNAGGTNVTAMTISPTGNVLIGTTTDNGNKLQVTGNANITGVLGINATATANIVLFPKGLTSGTGSFTIAAQNSSNSFIFILNDAGNVTISGSLSKGSGSFRIEHPLESLSNTHQLVHSFIEGPQADLIYRGKLTLVNGKGQANIDEIATMTNGTFEALCRDIQCFTTNESGYDLIKGKVIANIIYIESQNPNSTDEISWLVIGERKDKHIMDTDWTDNNGKVIVEPLKPILPLNNIN